MFELCHVERVIRHLVRFGASRADAEDLAQEALVIAWRKQSELEPDRSLDAWLYGISRNVYRNHTRTIRRRAEAAAPLDKDVVTDAPRLSDAVAVRDAVQSLPENQQDIVILHELEQYTLKETAELLDIPFDTAKDRLRRAREGLRARMQVDLERAVASERQHTSRLARAAAPVVLLGVVAALPGTTVAGTTATTVAAAAPISSKILLGVLAASVAIGVVAIRLVRSPSTHEAVPPPLTEVSHRDLDPAVRISDIDVVSDASPSLDSPTERDPGASAIVAAPARSPAPAAANPEVELVERARVALQRRSAHDAIRTLMAHERRFPTGELAEERDVLLVEAYFAAGDLRLSRSRLAHYRATHPHGLHRRRADDVERQLR